MKVVIDIPPKLLERIRAVVSQDDYDDPQEFITVAMMNQVEMENSGYSDNVISLTEAVNFESELSQPDTKDVVESSNSTGEQNIDLLKQSKFTQIDTVQIPERDCLEDGPLWGQYNRLFPVKLTLRGLANRLRGESQDAQTTADLESGCWTHAEQFKNAVATAAREYGTEIVHIDEKSSRTRTDKLATGLPVGDNPEKSKGRFKRHFVGSVNKNGIITGAPARLQFLNFRTESPKTIGITDAGLEFASLNNPLLDEGVEADRSLSTEEIEFYLDHIEENIPSEYQAMQVAAVSISQKINRPSDLTDQISSINDGWSNTHADTVRSGLVSRMVELELVTRKRVGQRGIAYQLTTEGEIFLENKEINE